MDCDSLSVKLKFVARGSPDLPQVNPVQTTFEGGYRGDAFVMRHRLDHTATNIVFASYLGGYFDEIGTSICTDLVGKAYIAGASDSLDFLTPNSLLPKANGFDGFVLQITGNSPEVWFSHPAMNGLGFSADIRKAGAAPVVIEISTNLVTWMPVMTNSAVEFRADTLFPAAVYRARTQ